MGPVSSAEEEQILQTTLETHVLDIEGGLLTAVHACFFLKRLSTEASSFFENHSIFRPKQAERLVTVENCPGGGHPACVCSRIAERCLLHVCVERRKDSLQPSQGRLCLKKIKKLC